MRFVLALLAAIIPAAALAQSGSDDLKRAIEALATGHPEQAFDQTMLAARTIARSLPFSIHRAVLTEGRATGFGMERERSSNRYRAGEDIDIYLELRGYEFDDCDGRFDFGFSSDLTLTDEAGQIYGGQNNVADWRYSSRTANLESYVTMTVAFTQFPAGRYVVELRVHDLSAGNVSAQARLPIEISG